MQISFAHRRFALLLLLFIGHAVIFSIYQYQREKDFKVDALDMRLQSYNRHLTSSLTPQHLKQKDAVDHFVATHVIPDLRVTVIMHDGQVVYDNKYPDYKRLASGALPSELDGALNGGIGHSVRSTHDAEATTYFYSATYFPQDSLFVRSALPYTSVSETLKPDYKFLWVVALMLSLLIIMLISILVKRDNTMRQLTLLADKASEGETIDPEEFKDFPNDDLGHIGQRIVAIYNRLQKSQNEQYELKLELTQNITHELKTPMASMMGYMETIQSHPDMDPKLRNTFLERCYTQCKRLSQLVTDISTLNRLDAAPNLTSLEQVDMVDIIRQVKNETALSIEQNDMQFNVYMPEHIYVPGNRPLLYSVIRNLTDNAIAYAGQGCSVTLRAHCDGSMAYFHFADNGPGVPREHINRIFERFYRIDKGRSRKMGGTGLGLAIVRNVINNHGGTIWADSAVDGGLQIFFTLPTKPA